ncbi:HdeD family acid-resistance protein [Taklimakanibacter deserti]|uniref:HdeD family acid-resistance protein n=1 Tax=Taklimakanibacter deserti TaxID=2267839 RepID=UPI000E64D86B
MDHTVRGAASRHVLVGRPWIPLLRGFWVVTLGEITLLLPDMTLAMLAILFGIYALVDGTIALVSAYRAPSIGANLWLALIGVCGILAGLFALLWPGLSAQTLLYCIAVWAVVLGLCEIAGGIALFKVTSHEWFYFLGGWVAIIFGAMLIYQSDEGVVALVWHISSFAIVFGVLLIAAAYRLRKEFVDSDQSAFLSD